MCSRATSLGAPDWGGASSGNGGLQASTSRCPVTLVLHRPWPMRPACRRQRLPAIDCSKSFFLPSKRLHRGIPLQGSAWCHRHSRASSSSLGRPATPPSFSVIARSLSTVWAPRESPPVRADRAAVKRIRRRFQRRSTTAFGPAHLRECFGARMDVPPPSREVDRGSDNVLLFRCRVLPRVGACPVPQRHEPCCGQGSFTEATDGLTL